MNWNLIKEKCPKACKLLLDENHWVWQGDELCYTHELDSFVSLRDIYDFMDKQGIIILTNIVISDEIITWNYTIHDKYNCVLGSEIYKFKSRTEAEGKAFEKAFEILEQILCLDEFKGITIKETTDEDYS